jgi:predicted HicB family RNase H-like nuclease
MENKKKSVDPLPYLFEMEQEAGEFWDTHSAADYIEYLETTEDTIEIKNRVFEVRVAEDVFQKLQREAESSHQSVPKVVDQILRKELTSV